VLNNQSMSGCGNGIALAIAEVGLGRTFCAQALASELCDGVRQLCEGVRQGVRMLCEGVRQLKPTASEKTLVDKTAPSTNKLLGKASDSSTRAVDIPIELKRVRFNIGERTPRRGGDGPPPRGVNIPLVPLIGEASQTLSVYFQRLMFMLPAASMGDLIGDARTEP